MNLMCENYLRDVMIVRKICKRSGGVDKFVCSIYWVQENM